MFQQTDQVEHNVKTTKYKCVFSEKERVRKIKQQAEQMRNSTLAEPESLEQETVEVTEGQYSKPKSNIPSRNFQASKICLKDDPPNYTDNNILNNFETIFRKPPKIPHKRGKNLLMTRLKAVGPQKPRGKSEQACL